MEVVAEAASVFATKEQVQMSIVDIALALIRDQVVSNLRQQK